jgi:hypothetical protein
MLIERHEESIVRSFVDEVYADKRTDLRLTLSYEQLINFLPDFLDDLARLLDQAAGNSEIIEAVRRLRSHAQVRFHQGVLLDEVARELTAFRNVFGDFLCREGGGVIRDDGWRMCAALGLTNRFIDELIAQTIVIYATSMRPAVKTRHTIWAARHRRT